MAISAQQLTIYLYSAHRAVIFAIAQLSCYCLRLRESMTHSVLTFVNFGCNLHIGLVYFRHIMRSTYGKITYTYTVRTVAPCSVLTVDRTDNTMSRHRGLWLSAVLFKKHPIRNGTPWKRAVIQYESLALNYCTFSRRSVANGVFFEKHSRQTSGHVAERY